MAAPKEPCPFCGSRSLRVKQLWQGRYRFVACSSCKAAGPVGRDEGEAVERWDDRDPAQRPLF